MNDWASINGSVVARLQDVGQVQKVEMRPDRFQADVELEGGVWQVTRVNHPRESFPRTFGAVADEFRGEVRLLFHALEGHGLFAPRNGDGKGPFFVCTHQLGRLVYYSLVSPFTEVMPSD